MAFAMWVGGEPVITFLTICSILVFMASLVGLYPKWIIIFSIIAVSGVFAKTIAGMVK
jgi:hypothetical protein